MLSIYFFLLLFIHPSSSNFYIYYIERAALRTAADCGNLPAMEWLISKGANVNLADPLGTTALHSAVMKGKRDVAELLISKGANLEALKLG